MTNQTIHWLDEKALRFLAHECAARFGGTPLPVKDDALALVCKQPKDYKVMIAQKGGETTLNALAAIYAYSILRLNPFARQNKRMALLAVSLFMRLNGADFSPAPAEAARAIRALANKTITPQDFAQWVGG